MLARRVRLAAFAAFAAAALAAAGCGGDAERGEPTRSDRPASAAAPSIAKRCSLPLKGPVQSFRGPDGSTLTGAALGRGRHAAVFLHQRGSEGFCGFLPYASWASRGGVMAIAVDGCLIASSRCTPAVEHDPAAMIRIPVRWAREHGARTVTVVGASMGGSLALGAGQQAGADAIVDLSGPTSWEGVPPARTAARALKGTPLLVVAARNDRDTDYAQLRRSVAVAPVRHKRFVTAPGSQHGWDTLLDFPDLEGTPTPIGRLVLRWIQGRYG